MNYFIVFQNKTYIEEMKGGYLWAPQRNKRGHEIFHWTNMIKVKDGDIIFSMYKRNLVSVNIAKDKAIDATRPADLDKVNLWEEDGWLLKAEYKVLDNPVSISDNIDEILKLCPSKYSPFTVKGSGNQGYLFEIGKEFGEYLLKLANDINNIDNARVVYRLSDELLNNMYQTFKIDWNKEDFDKLIESQLKWIEKKTKVEEELKNCDLVTYQTLIEMTLDKCEEWTEYYR